MSLKLKNSRKFYSNFNFNLLFTVFMNKFLILLSYKSDKDIEKSEIEASMRDGEERANRAKSIINHSKFVVINDARGLSLPAMSINIVNARQMDTVLTRSHGSSTITIVLASVRH